MSHKSVRLDKRHIEFLNNHPEVNFSALARQAIEQRMEIQQKLNEMSFSGSIRESGEDIQFQASMEEETKRNGEVPVRIEIKPLAQGGVGDE